MPIVRLDVNSIDVLDIDLKRHQDTKKLMALGSEVTDAAAFESCPTCHQHVTQELLPPSSSGAMALDENIAFIKSQQLMYKSALATTEESRASFCCRVIGTPGGSSAPNRHPSKDTPHSALC